ncbi:hypothetical protein SAMN05443634_105218 [Chishuiella changwenlii]|uniref:Uncharacterized protein n=1 Tax=Chishuiella changwenlii TaxID=1434701 RepID=A0A1M6XED6_9FLAO|nr:hypothetical protein [Chishuiella changwenlii]GGF00543.1 hypothetical protein GCM10010984_17700 [Chishuiella changwenlii]SHL04291.1 hypothetical protein SAMN05443634_105218 [Chishuiella changwenlii]
MNMKLNEIEKLIDCYSFNYRNSSMKDIEIGELIKLDINNLIDEYNEPENWEFNNNSGICLFLNAEKTIIHIIQAVQLGPGISAHFTLSGLKSNWKKNEPKFILPIKVPDESNFERHSLKDFLINHKKFYKI